MSLRPSQLLRAATTLTNAKAARPKATKQRRTAETAATSAQPAISAQSATSPAPAKRSPPATARALDKGKARADPPPDPTLEPSPPTPEPTPASDAQPEASTSTSEQFSEPVPTASETYLNLLPSSEKTDQRPAYSRAPVVRHPFSTYRFVERLEKASFSPEVARAFMRAMKQMLMMEEKRAARELVAKTDLENETYLFSAALSELRTEVQVQARNDTIAQHSANNLLQREVDSLSQRMREDVQTLKNDIQLDINNRKDETTADLKALELAISELSGKFTSMLGDVRTEVEDVKLVVTRNFMLLIGIALIGIVVFDPLAPAEPKTPSAAELGVQPLDADREPTAGGPPVWLSNWALSGKRVGEEEQEETTS